MASGDDFDLIRQVKAGSREAFAELVKRYQSRVINVVYHMVGDRDDAEDVAQECFAKAFHRIDSFDFRSGFYTWLYRISVNTATDFLKKMRRRRAVPLDSIPVTQIQGGELGQAPDRSAVRKELSGRVMEILALLPEKYRTVLILRELEEQSYEDIAAILRISVGTVESRLHRARARLREKLDRYLRSGD